MQNKYKKMGYDDNNNKYKRVSSILDVDDLGTVGPDVGLERKG